MTPLKHTLELVLNPFFFIIVLLMIAFYLLRAPVKQGLTIILLFIIIILLLFSTGWIPRVMTHNLEHTYPIVQKVDPHIRWIVVLGGGHYEALDLTVNNLLSGASIKRLVEGVRLLRALPNARLLLSGGGETKLNSDALLLAELSRWFYVSADKISLEAESLTTQEQARALGTYVGKEPFYLVTSAIHMPRAIFLCQQQGLNPIAAPTDFTFFWNDSNNAKIYIPNVYNFYYFNIAMHELLGRCWAKLNYLARSPA